MARQRDAVIRAARFRIAMRVPAAAIALLAGLWFWPVPAWACKCAPLTASSVTGSAAAIFVGRVVSRELPPDDLGYRYSFRVLKSWKGSNARELAVTTGFGGGDCGVPFQIGTTYLVLATRRGTVEPGPLTTNICLGSDAWFGDGHGEGPLAERRAEGQKELVAALGKPDAEFADDVGPLVRPPSPPDTAGILKRMVSVGSVDERLIAAAPDATRTGAWVALRARPTVGEEEIRLRHVDSDGTVGPTVTVHGLPADRGASILLPKDLVATRSGFVLWAWAWASVGSGSDRLFFLDPDGTLRFTRDVTAAWNVRLERIASAGDGDLLVAGHVRHQPADSSWASPHGDVLVTNAPQATWFAKITPLGELAWRKPIAGEQPALDHVLDLASAPDGGATALLTTTRGDEIEHAWLLTLDAGGVVRREALVRGAPICRSSDSQGRFMLLLHDAEGRRGRRNATRFVLLSQDLKPLEDGPTSEPIPPMTLLPVPGGFLVGPGRGPAPADNVLIAWDRPLHERWRLHLPSGEHLERAFVAGGVLHVVSKHDGFGGGGHLLQLPVGFPPDHP